MKTKSLSIDIFPARVTIPGRTLAKARVVVQDGKARLYEESRGVISVVAESDVKALEKSDRPRYRPHLISTEQGDWQIIQGGGCGCGSKLKGMRPSELANLELA